MGPNKSIIQNLMCIEEVHSYISKLRATKMGTVRVN